MGEGGLLCNNLLLKYGIVCAIGALRFVQLLRDLVNSATAASQSVGRDAAALSMESASII